MDDREGNPGSSLVMKLTFFTPAHYNPGAETIVRQIRHAILRKPIALLAT